MSFLQLVLLLDKTIEGINSILPIVSYRNISLSELRMSVHENITLGVRALGVEFLYCFFWMSGVVLEFLEF